MDRFFRILKRLTIYRLTLPLYLWIIDKQYSRMEREGKVADRAW